MIRAVYSGAGTNLKVGAPIRCEAAEKIFWVVPLHFLALKAQLVVLVGAFVMISTVWSVSCLLCSHSRSPRAQSFVKVGGTCPVPYGVFEHFGFVILDGAAALQFGAAVMESDLNKIHAVREFAALYAHLGISVLPSHLVVSRLKSL